MKHPELMAISPLDGRYADKTKSLRDVFSEFALMKFRILVEVQWLQHLQPNLSEAAHRILDMLYLNFTEEDALHIKKIEKTTNHDVKAVEYFIKEKIKHNKELQGVSEWIHFGCTSDDINNLAYALMLEGARQQIILPTLDELMLKLRNFSHEFALVPMLSRTHGQPATPTTVGKEFANVLLRLERHVQNIVLFNPLGKMNGAVGNFNAHQVVFPEKNWLEVAKSFVEKLGLTYQAYTTQIEPHDYMAEFFHTVMRINTTLIDFSRDCWGYIALNYFELKTVKEEIGSSTMPHKINPIDFENAEGNLYLSNSILSCLADKLPLSRFQRDLVDSTLLRNIGVGIGHGFVAYQSLLKGLEKIDINKAHIESDLDNAWEVLAEPIQMAMRVEGIENGYEKLKDLTRGKVIKKEALHKFIDATKLSAGMKKKLKNLTPATYIGYAGVLAEEV